MWEALKFTALVAVVVFFCDFAYAAFNQGRHLNQAFKRHLRKKRPR